jgi:hypothetical protein
MKTQTKAHTFEICSECATPLDRPSPQRLPEPLRFNKTNALLAFLGFIVRPSGTEQHSHAAMQTGWGHHVLPYHARCPE